MNKMSGIKKLRLGITLVFLLLVGSVVIGWYVTSIETEADEVFFERLTTEDINDIDRIFNKYPNVDFANRFLELAGVFVWIAILGVSYLMYKVWKVKEIR